MRAPPGETAPLAGLLQALLRHRLLLVALPTIGFALGAAWVVAFRKHIAEAILAPATTNQNTQGVSGLAQQLGLPLALPGNNESVEFYRALLMSRDLMVDAVESQYRFATWPGGRDTLSGTLIELYRVTGATDHERLHKAWRRLRSSTSVGMDQRASLMTVRVATPWPEGSEQVARRLLELMNRFNLEKRQSRARAERTFLESRLAEAAAALESAEAAQKRFLERNRAWQGDPELVHQQQGLARRVDQSSQVYSRVSQLYEQAKIDEVRDTPVITVVQDPRGTSRPQQRLRYGALFGFFLGALAAAGIVLVAEYAALERKANPEAYANLTRQLRLRRSAP